MNKSSIELKEKLIHYKNLLSLLECIRRIDIDKKILDTLNNIKKIKEEINRLENN